MISGRLILPTLFFFFKIVLAILVPLPFHINFRITISVSTKKLAGIFIGIMVNLYINYVKPIHQFVNMTSLLH